MAADQRPDRPSLQDFPDLTCLDQRQDVEDQPDDRSGSRTVFSKQAGDAQTNADNNNQDKRSSEKHNEGIHVVHIGSSRILVGMFWGVEHPATPRSNEPRVIRRATKPCHNEAKRWLGRPLTHSEPNPIHPVVTQPMPSNLQVFLIKSGFPGFYPLNSPNILFYQTLHSFAQRIANQKVALSIAKPMMSVSGIG